MHDKNRREFNPYAAPELTPLRGFWTRFFSSLGRAIHSYREDMRKQRIGLLAQFCSWLLLFILVSMAVCGMVALLIFLIRLTLSS